MYFRFLDGIVTQLSFKDLMLTFVIIREMTLIYYTSKKMAKTNYISEYYNSLKSNVVLFVFKNSFDPWLMEFIQFNNAGQNFNPLLF